MTLLLAVHRRRRDTYRYLRSSCDYDDALCQFYHARARLYPCRALGSLVFTHSGSGLEDLDDRARGVPLLHADGSYGLPPPPLDQTLDSITPDVILIDVRLRTYFDNAPAADLRPGIIRQWMERRRYARVTVIEGSDVWAYGSLPSTMRNESIFRRLWRPAVLVVFGLGMGLLLGELILRLVPLLIPFELHSWIAHKPWLLAPPPSLPPFFAEYRKLWEEDEVLRDRLKPNVDTILRGNSEYPIWHIRADSLGLGLGGFRDSLPDREPYAVVLGDSFGFGVGVAQEQTWMEVLEHETGLPFVNLSRVGASSLHEVIIYTRTSHRLPSQGRFLDVFRERFEGEFALCPLAESRCAHYARERSTYSTSVVGACTSSCGGTL